MQRNKYILNMTCAMDQPIQTTQKRRQHRDQEVNAFVEKFWGEHAPDEQVMTVEEETPGGGADGHEPLSDKCV